MSPTDKTILLWPDTHVPDHSVKVVNNLIGFIAEFDLDEIVFTGDFLDMKGPARWSKGTAAEYESNLQEDADKGVKVLGMVRDVFDGPIKMHLGNHDIRVDRYLAQYAPALRHLRGLRYDSLLELPTMGIELLPRAPYSVAPGWVTTHGDEGRTSTVAGATATALARRYRVSVACGHTHRLGVISETSGLRSSTLTGFELGHLMNTRMADYLSLPPNWQMGFGLLHVSGRNVKPEPVPVNKDGSFVIEGVVYP